jgi:hypothetical protein
MKRKKKFSMKCHGHAEIDEGQRDVVRTTLYLVNLTGRMTGHGPSDFFEKNSRLTLLGARDAR